MTRQRDRLSRRLAGPQGEDGSALLLVLVFVVVFGLLLGSILNFSGTGLKTASRIGEVRDMQHAADGAIQGAIDNLRTAQLGPVDGPCTTPNTFTPPAATGDPTVVVTCTRKALSGSPAPPTDVPNWAILTVGTAAGEGFHAAMTGSGYNLQVNGGIFSYGDLQVDSSGTLSVVGRAVGLACTPPLAAGCPAPPPSTSTTCDSARIASTVPAECGPTSPTASSADAASYDYPHQAMTLPTTGTPVVAGTLVDPLPTCPGGASTGVINFQPGMYTVQPKYLASKASCSSSVWWFSPGTYYFRFPDSDSQWVMNSPTKTTVIGGTPNGWTGSSTANAVKSLLDLGNDGCVKGTDGVQFIMGGQTRILTPQDGDYLHLCAKDPSPTPPTAQQIAIYALRPASCGCLGAETASTAITNETHSPSAVSVSVTAPSTAVPTNALPMVLSLDKTKPTATVTASSFAGIPEGSTIQSFGVQIAHTEADAARLSEQLNLTFPSGTATCAVADDGTCNVNLANLGQGNLPAWRDINQMSAALVVTRSNQGANPMAYTLTTLNVVVSYTPPRFEKTNVAAGSYLIQAANSNPTVKLYGTLFAPDSAVAVKLHNKGDSVFHRGVIARTIDAVVISSSTQNDAPFQLPSSNAGREVLLTAYVNDTSSPSNIRVRARVRFVDVNTNGTPDPTDDIGIPGYKVQVLNWQVVR